MAWLETNVLEERTKFVVEALAPGANRRALCRQYGISPPTGYKWLGRAEADSLAALGDRSRRPHHSPLQTPEAVTARVVALRQAFGWAGRKLQPLLAAEGIALSTATIDRIIRREGLTHAEASHRPAPTRFERRQPNELWQMDFKGQYPATPTGWCFPLSILDDYSRYAVGLAALASTDGAGVQRVLTRCFETYGVPDALLVDHGVPWWSRYGHGLTRLAVFILKQGIDLRYSGIAHPQTQGKVERFHRTLGTRLRQWGVPSTLGGFARTFRAFRTEYNDIRPHEARDLEPPARHYHRSPRPYRAQPAPWVYAPHVEVLRVDHAGCIWYARRRCFVSAALIDEWVGCTPFDGQLLVTYRHMHIRQIDLRTGRSTPLIHRAE